MSSAAAVANPQVQTKPAPALPPDTPILAAPPRDPEMVQPQQPPVLPLIPPAPPTIDEPALRERELAVERREEFGLSGVDSCKTLQSHRSDCSVLAPIRDARHLSPLGLQGFPPYFRGD